MWLASSSTGWRCGASSSKSGPLSCWRRSFWGRPVTCVALAGNRHRPEPYVSVTEPTVPKCTQGVFQPLKKWPPACGIPETAARRTAREALAREGHGAAEPCGLQLHELCAAVHTAEARIGVASSSPSAHPVRSARRTAGLYLKRRRAGGPEGGQDVHHRCSSPEACFAIVRGAAFFRVGAIGIDRPVGEHQLPAFTGPELGLNGVEQDVRRLVRRAELSALLQEAPGDEECVLDGAANGHGCQRGAAVAVPRDRRMLGIGARARVTSAS